MLFSYVDETFVTILITVQYILLNLARCLYNKQICQLIPILINALSQYSMYYITCIRHHVYEVAPWKLSWCWHMRLAGLSTAQLELLLRQVVPVMPLMFMPESVLGAYVKSSSSRFSFIRSLYLQRGQIYAP